jgi:hypothetical protein
MGVDLIVEDDTAAIEVGGAVAWCAANDANCLRPLTRERWEVLGRLHRIAVLPRRGGEEQALELGYGRHADLDRGVAPVGIPCVAIGGNAGRGRVLVGAGQVDAARDADVPVHHHDLAVVAVVGLQQRHGIDRVIGQHPRASAPHGVEQFARCRLRPIGVVDDVDRHVPPQLADQHIGEPAPLDLDVLENEILQVAMVARRIHRPEHCRQRLRAAHQQPGLIAEHQRPVRQRMLRRVMPLQWIVCTGAIRIEVRHRGASLQCRRGCQGEQVTAGWDVARHDRCPGRSNGARLYRLAKFCAVS